MVSHVDVQKKQTVRRIDPGHWCGDALARITSHNAPEPRAANVWYDRANAYLDKDNYDRAIADYTEALRLNPNDTAALVNRGIAYRDKGQYDQAIEDHDRAIRLDLHPPATDYVDPLDHSISMST